MTKTQKVKKLVETLLSENPQLPEPQHQAPAHDPSGASVQALINELKGCGWKVEKNPRRGTATLHKLSTGEMDHTYYVDLQAEGGTITALLYGEAEFRHDHPSPNHPNGWEDTITPDDDITLVRPVNGDMHDFALEIDDSTGDVDLPDEYPDEEPPAPHRPGEDDDGFRD